MSIKSLSTNYSDILHSTGLVFITAHDFYTCDSVFYCEAKLQHTLAGHSVNSQETNAHKNDWFMHMEVSLAYKYMHVHMYMEH